MNVCANVIINVTSKFLSLPHKDSLSIDVYLENLKNKIQLDIQEALKFVSEYP